MCEAGASGEKSYDKRGEYLQQLVEMQESLYCIKPLSWCPHLEIVTHVLPEGGLDTSAPCKTCGDINENWVCLTCYKVYCSRYINGHMLMHNKVEPDHCMVLSYADISVWCYICNSYVDHEITQAAKNSACKHKFGE